VRKLTPEEIGEEQRQLADLFPAGHVVQFAKDDGKWSVTLYPMTLGECVRCLSFMRPIVIKMIETAGPTDSTIGAGESVGDFVRRIWSAVVIAIGEYPDAFMQALACGMGWQVKAVGTIPPAFALPIVSALFEINAAFFAQSLASLVSGSKATTPTTPTTTTENNFVGVGPTP
jgi:hypothetical protein